MVHFEYLGCKATGSRLGVQGLSEGRTWSPRPHSTGGTPRRAASRRAAERQPNPGV